MWVYGCFCIILHRVGVSTPSCPMGSLVVRHTWPKLLWTRCCKKDCTMTPTLLAPLARYYDCQCVYYFYIPLPHCIYCCQYSSVFIRPQPSALQAMIHCACAKVAYDAWGWRTGYPAHATTSSLTLQYMYWSISGDGHAYTSCGRTGGFWETAAAMASFSPPGREAAKASVSAAPPLPVSSGYRYAGIGCGCLLLHTKLHA